MSRREGTRGQGTTPVISTAATNNTTLSPVFCLPSPGWGEYSGRCCHRVESLYICVPPSGEGNDGYIFHVKDWSLIIHGKGRGGLQNWRGRSTFATTNGFSHANWGQKS